MEDNICEMIALQVQFPDGIIERVGENLEWAVGAPFLPAADRGFGCEKIKRGGDASYVGVIFYQDIIIAYQFAFDGICIGEKAENNYKENAVEFHFI